MCFEKDVESTTAITQSNQTKKVNAINSPHEGIKRFSYWFYSLHQMQRYKIYTPAPYTMGYTVCRSKTKTKKQRKQEKKFFEKENEHKKGDLRECGRIVVCMKYDNEIWLCYPVISTIKWTIECESEREEKLEWLLTHCSCYTYIVCVSDWLQLEYHFGIRSKLYRYIHRMRHINSWNGCE